MQVDRVKTLLFSTHSKRKRGWNVYFLRFGLSDKWFTYKLHIALWLTIDKICWLQLNIFSSSKNRIYSYILWIKLKWAWQFWVWVKYNIFLKEYTFVPNVFWELLFSGSKLYRELLSLSWNSLTRVQLCNPWTVACQAPLSVGFFRQEYWVGCHLLLQRIFPTQGLNPCLLRYRLVPLELSGKPNNMSSSLQSGRWVAISALRQPPTSIPLPLSPRLHSPCWYFLA